MAKRNRKIRKNQVVLLVVLTILIIWSIGYGCYINAFNETERSFSPGEENEAFTIGITPKSGKTDSWVKLVGEGEDQVSYQGTIYDATVTNTGDCSISDWTLRIEVPEECYLNNAWCGTVEIHQNVSETEKVQTLDLRDYNVEEITLDYTLEGPDLMVPLHKGDYLVYYPSAEVDEYPISYPGTGKTFQVGIGMIFYTTEEVPVEFSNYYVDYHLEKSLFHNRIFYLLSAGWILWFMYLIISITVAVNMRKARRRFRKDEHIIRQSIGVFTRFFDAKDADTNGHSQRVAKYARKIAERLGYTEEECRQIYYVALMHDCGKCYIADEILKKPGKLTTEEYEVIKSHTSKGAGMVEDFSALEQVREGVLYHHERYDGTGYPEGLAGEEIPMVSRIICISDSFDAMNSRRCYRPNLTREKILSELKNNSGKQFDPKLVEVMLELIHEGEITFSDENLA